MKTAYRLLALALPVILGMILAGDAWSQDQRQGLSLFEGQTLIFRGYDCSDRIKVKWKEPDSQSGIIDLGVGVRRIKQEKSKVTLTLENIGSATMRGKPYKGCPIFVDSITLTVADIPASVTDNELVAGVQSLLLTPESYLASKGYQYSASVETEDHKPPALDEPLPATQSVVPLLILNPKFPEEGKKRRVGGKVVASVVIGADGRAYSPKFVESPGKEFEREVLRILPLCRYESPLRNGKPFAVRTMIVWTFNIY